MQVPRLAITNPSQRLGSCLKDVNSNTAGGGINSKGSALTMHNTILANNRAPVGPNCSAALTSTGHNLIGDLTDCSVLGETASNILVDDALRDVLSANAQQTWSQMPLDTGKAVDAGTCALPTAQNGLARPQGNGCDISAVEYVAKAEVVIVITRNIYLPMIAQ